MRLILLLNTILIGFLASGCTLTVPNLEVCRDKGRLGAHCAFTNAGPSRDIPVGVWNETRFGQFCMTEEVFARNQLFVEQACELSKNCKLEEVRKAYKLLLENLGK